MPSLHQRMTFGAIWKDVHSTYAHLVTPATLLILFVHLGRVILLVTSQMYHASYNAEHGGNQDTFWSPIYHYHDDERNNPRWFRAEPQTNSRSTMYWTILTGLAFAMELVSRFHMHAFVARGCVDIYNGKETNWIATCKAVYSKCGVACMMLVFLVTVCHNKLYGETIYLLLAALGSSFQKRHVDTLDDELIFILVELGMLIYFVGPMLLVIPVYMNENDASMTCWEATQRAWQLAEGYRCHFYASATFIMSFSEIAINSINYVAVLLLFGKSTIIANLLCGQLQHIVLPPLTCVLGSVLYHRIRKQKDSEAARVSKQRSSSNVIPVLQATPVYATAL
ncbi:hypothetical protein FisN_35Lh022 [Fistulifera solaris]|uniref:Uncharacterized protein n=1 Tax=Fistulifera solaris TaxID=1519565 RepID=A0A1Z5KR67_FISSO|nr:hypothetical protein FisN_35Lh022 [Fistulifera solaris]|eukprot:GAX28813.1 hypothetical protein FisN_35Lh022 [Fistulifera solaris]